MPTQRPAAPSKSAPKPSRSLSGSLCALFTDADSGSGMKAELSPRPGVSDGAPPKPPVKHYAGGCVTFLLPEPPSLFHFISW